MEETAFWLCWSPTGKIVPQHRHSSLEEAQAEARRLVTQHGGPVYVLLAVGAARQEKPPVVYEIIP